MKVKELKEILNDIPDDYNVCVYSDHGQMFEDVYDHIHGHVLNSEECWTKGDCEECDDIAYYGKSTCEDCKYKDLKEDAIILFGE
jgi:hypothetical protein